MQGITVANLTKTFDTEPIVRDLHLEIAPGEIVALLGPSGCGKTTTLRCIAGLEHPDRGRIVINDQVVCDMDAGILVPPERRNVGMMFQSYAVWPHMTVFDNVAYGLRVKRIPGQEIQRRVTEVLTTVGLADKEDRYPAMLSGGEQQRVALARSLVTEPTVLLMDEPLSNLDLKLRERMRVELRSLLKKVGHTGIYVTHDQSDAMVLADRLVLMNAGRIVEIGEPREVYRRPTTVFGSAFLGTANLLSFAEITSQGDGFMGRLPQGHVLHLPEDSVTREYVIRPERVAAARCGEKEWNDNVIKGRILTCTFLGNMTFYEADCDGLNLTFQDTDAEYEVGESIELRLPPRWLTPVA